MAQIAFPKAIESYLLDCHARNLRPATLTTYRLQLGYFSTFATDKGATSCAEISTELIRSYFAHLLQRGLSAASVRTAARTLRIFLTWCVAEGLIDDTPMRRVKMPRVDQPRPDSFTLDEVRTLLETAETARDRALVLFLLDTGARLGETAALHVADVDLANGRVLLRTQTKSRRPRSVFLGYRARQALGEYLVECPAAAHEPLWRQHKGRGGAALNRDGLQEAIKRLGRRAGVHPCAPHKFRRTFALWSLRAGIDVESLRRLLGHSTDDLLKYYVSLADDDLRAAHAAHGPVDRILR